MSTTESAGVGPPPKRRVIEGFPPPSGTSYPLLLPASDSRNIRIMAPISQTENGSDGEASFIFNFKTHYNQFIRLVLFFYTCVLVKLIPPLTFPFHLVGLITTL